MPVSDECDLVVVGAGPSGIALAGKVAATGASVLVLESRSTPGDGRTWIVDVERTVFDEARVPHPTGGELWPEPESHYLTSWSGQKLVRLRPSPAVPVRNDRYLTMLAGWAADRGAEFRYDTPVAGPLMDRGSVVGVVIARGGGGEEIRAKVVADCSGISGVVRRGTPDSWLMNERVRPADTALARREVLSIDPGKAERAVEEGRLTDRQRVDRVATRGAYSTECSYLDIEGGYVDLLVGIKDSPSLPSADERFREVLSDWSITTGKVFGDGGPIPIRSPLDVPVGDGLVVLGDSACQVIPAHGSGTASALIAADLAAAALKESLRRGSFTRSDLWGYASRFMRGRGAVLGYYDVLRLQADTLSSEDLDEIVSRGLLDAEDVYSGMVPLAYRPGPVSALRKLLAGLPVLPLLAGFVYAGVRAGRMARCFRSYPERYDAGSLDRWMAERRNV